MFQRERTSKNAHNDTWALIPSSTVRENLDCPNCVLFSLGIDAIWSLVISISMIDWD